MSQLLGTIGAMIAFAAACCIPTGIVWLGSRWFARRVERPRPPLPSNDIYGEVVRLPRDLKSFGGVDHARRFDT